MYDILNILFPKSDELDQNINEKDPETIKYARLFQNIYNDCLKIGEYYIKKIIQILEKINNLNKSYKKLINIEVLDKYEHELNKINNKFIKIVCEIDAIDEKDTKIIFIYKKEIREEKFTQIKNILDEYYNYNDIDVWRVINKN
jgi:hypothetical protein